MLILQRNMVNKKLILIFGIFLFIIPQIIAIRINEVMPWPIQTDSYNEWVEVYNDGSESIDLSEYTLCEKTLLGGYIDYNDGQILKNDNGLILEPGQYVIISDGGSGTQVYSNFQINSNTLNIHVDASSLCGGLANSGKNITLEKNSVIIDSFKYPEAENGKSFSLISEEIQITEPTPGSENKEMAETENQNQSSNESSENESKDEEKDETQKKDSGPETIYISQKNVPENKNNVLETINLNTEKNSERLTKSDYALYGLGIFAVLIIILFLIRKNKYKNEFG